jgi:hypothetical protein
LRVIPTLSFLFFLFYFPWMNQHFWKTGDSKSSKSELHVHDLQRVSQV